MAGGRLVLPLTMAALRVLGRIPANPLALKEGGVCPRKVILSQQDLSVETMVDCFAGLAKVEADKVFTMDQPKGLELAFYKYCLDLLKAMGPERTEDPPPKT